MKLCYYDAKLLTQQSVEAQAGGKSDLFVRMIDRRSECL